MIHTCHLQCLFFFFVFNPDDLEILPQVDADFTEGGGGEGGVWSPPCVLLVMDEEGDFVADVFRRCVAGCVAVCFAVRVMQCVLQCVLQCG